MTATARDMDDWAPFGACRKTDPEAYYPEVGQTVETAKRVCNGKGEVPACPVRDQCRRWALGIDGNPWEEHGVWGGLSKRERMKERRRLGLAPAQPEHFRSDAEDDEDTEDEEAA